MDESLEPYYCPMKVDGSWSHWRLIEVNNEMYLRVTNDNVKNKKKKNKQTKEIRKYDKMTKKWVITNDNYKYKLLFDQKLNFRSNQYQIINQHLSRDKLRHHYFCGFPLSSRPGLRFIITDKRILVFKYTSLCNNKKTKKSITFQEYSMNKNEWSKIYQLQQQQIQILKKFTTIISVGLEIESNLIVSFATNKSICLFDIQKKMWSECIKSISLPIQKSTEHMQMLKLNHYDHAITIVDDTNTQRDNTIIGGFCREFELNNNNNYLPKYIQRIIVNYHLNQEIYLIRTLEIHSKHGDPHGWTFQAWRFPTSIMFS